MQKLRAIKLFVRLSDLGSFTAVADELRASKSMVSKEISRLEETVGARLVNRSTRRLELTDIGRGYLERCRAILGQVEAADAYVQQMQSAPRGTLRINAPMALGVTDLGRAFADFMAAYPDIRLEVNLSDEPVDLIERGFDLGFRAASRQFDSAYVGVRLTAFRYVICASPEYLETHPAPVTPEALKTHNCFVYSYFRGGAVWPLGEGIRVAGTLEVNSTLFMLDCIKRGLGVGFLPEFVAREALASGVVVELLSEMERPELILYAMYPQRELVAPKVKLCISFLRAWFAGTDAV